MPSTHLKEAPRPRHKAKPKFDVPVATSQGDAPVGWVYRAEEIPPQPPPPQIEAAPVSDDTHFSDDHPALMVGKGFLLIGLGTMGIVSGVTRGLIVAPMRFAKWMLPD